MTNNNENIHIMRARARTHGFHENTELNAEQRQILDDADTVANNWAQKEERALQNNANLTEIHPKLKMPRRLL